MKTIPYIIYGGDTCQDGTQCGLETKRRCEKAISFIESRKNLHFVIILAAGKRPDKPSYPLLKEVMKDYLLKRLRNENTFFRIPYIPDIILAEQDGWGTFKESLVASKEVYKLNVKKIYINSSWYHIPRILFIWFILEGLKTRIRPVFTPSPKISSLVTEIISFLKVFISWYKWKH